SSAPEVAQQLAEAMPAVVNADAGLVFLWDSEADGLALHGRHGWPGHVHDRVGAVVLRPADSVAVDAFVANPEPALVRVEEVDDSLRAVAESLEVDTLACVPIQHRGDLLGLAVAGFPEHAAPRVESH